MSRLSFRRCANQLCETAGKLEHVTMEHATRDSRGEVGQYLGKISTLLAELFGSMDLICNYGEMG